MSKIIPKKILKEWGEAYQKAQKEGLEMGVVFFPKGPQAIRRLTREEVPPKKLKFPDYIKINQTRFEGIIITVGKETSLGLRTYEYNTSEIETNDRSLQFKNYLDTDYTKIFFKEDTMIEYNVDPEIIKRQDPEYKEKLKLLQEFNRKQIEGGLTPVSNIDNLALNSC